MDMVTDSRQEPVDDGQEADLQLREVDNETSVHLSYAAEDVTVDGDVGEGGGSCVDSST